MVEQVTIPNLAGLSELASRDGVDIKPTLLRVVTDLYVQKPQHSAEEERHYTELAVRLIGQVDAPTRAIVTERLTNYAAAPSAVTESLVQYRIEHGEAKAGATPVAAPPSSSAAAVEPLHTTAINLSELTELFLAADAQERRMILLHLEFSELAPAPAISPQSAQETIRRLELAALTHNSDSFAQEVERALSIGRSLARRLIDDPSGEPVLVLATALEMPAEVLQRVLLCLNPAISHSVLRVYELSKLYEEIEPQSALRLIAIWQATHKPALRPPAGRPALQPQHYDDGKQPGMPARPAIRWEEHALRREGER